MDWELIFKIVLMTVGHTFWIFYLPIQPRLIAESDHDSDLNGN